MSFLNAALLFGLVAVLIPPLIHLLNRKRFDVVEWAAMQFLQVSRRVRRKVLIEELILMLIRMGLLALLVFALAAPVLHGSWFANLGVKPSRDAVFVFDASASMGFGDADEDARDAANRLIDESASGDAFGVVRAGPIAETVVEELQPDTQRVRDAIRTMPAPSGGVDAASALNAGLDIIIQSKVPGREIVILTDGQRHGWADERTLQRLELLAAKHRVEGREWPRVWVLNVAGERADAVNWTLTPLSSTRPVAVVGREVRFRTSLLSTGTESGQPPERMTVEIDGRPAGSVNLPGVSAGGRIPLSFTRRFTTPGSHLVTVRIPDDTMPGDNRQDFAVEVLDRIPVLIVDGDPGNSASERTSDFLRDALHPARDPSPAFDVAVVPVSRFESAMLDGRRVLILTDVPTLSPAQQAAVEAFLRNGGGVLATLGERVDQRFYTDVLFREGDGWFPARPVDAIGDTSDLENAPRPVTESFAHPAVEPLREDHPGSLASAYFPRHWRLNLPENAAASPMAMLGDRTPLLVERSFGRGRVIAAAVPMDASWRTNLTRLPDFPRLAHELGYHLAGARGAELNLAPGQPIVFRPADDSVPQQLTVTPPEGEAYPLTVRTWPAVIDRTALPGPYRLVTETGEMRYYVIRPDAAESVLTPMSEDDRAKLAGVLPTARFTGDLGEVIGGLDEGGEAEVWWLGMALVVLLLCAEIAMTRRMATRSPPIS